MITPKVVINDQTFWFIKSSKSLLEINDIVGIEDGWYGPLTGIIQYLNDDKAGIRLIGSSAGNGYTDGTRNGIKHFSCPPQDGIYVLRSRLIKLHLAKKDQERIQYELESQGIHYTFPSTPQEALPEKEKRQCDTSEVFSSGKEEREAPPKRSPVEEGIYELDRNSIIENSPEQQYPTEKKRNEAEPLLANENVSLSKFDGFKEEQKVKVTQSYSENLTTPFQKIQNPRNQLKDHKADIKKVEKKLMITQSVAIEYAKAYDQARTRLMEFKTEQEKMEMRTSELQKELENQKKATKKMEEKLEMQKKSLECDLSTEKTELKVIETEAEIEHKHYVLDELNIQLKQQKKDVKDLEAKLADAKNETLRYKECNELAEMSLVKLKVGQKEKDLKNDKLRTKLEKQKKETEELELKLTIEQDEALKYLDYNGQAEKKLMQTLTMLEGKEKSKREFHTQLKKQESKIVNLEENLADVQTEALKHTEVNDEAEGRFSEVQKEKEHKEREIKQLRINTKEMEEALPDLKAELINARDEEGERLNDQNQGNFLKSTGEQKTVEAKTEQLHREVAMLEKVLASKDAKLAETQEETFAYKQSYEAAERSLVQIKAEQEEIDQKTDDLKRWLEKQQKEMVLVEGKLTIAESQALTHKVSKEEVEAQLKELQYEQLAKEGKIEQLNTALKNQQTIINDMESKLSGVQEQALKYKVMIKQTKNKVTSLKEELHEQKADSREKTEKLKDSQKEMRIAEEQKQAVEAHIGELKNSLRQAEEEKKKETEKLQRSLLESHIIQKRLEDDADKFEYLLLNSEKKTSELLAQIETQTVTIKELENMVVELKGEKEQSEKANKQLKLFMGEHENITEQLRLELKDGKMARSTTEKKLTQYQASLEKAERRLMELTIEQKEKDDQSLEALAQMLQFKKDLSVSEETLIKVKNEIRQCRASSEEAERKYKELKSEKDVQKKENEELLIQLGDKIKALHDLEEESETLRKEALKYQKSKGLADIKVAELTTAQKEAEDRISSLEETCAKERQQRYKETEKLKKSLEESRSIQNHLEARSQALEESLLEYEKNNSAENAEIRTLREELEIVNTGNVHPQIKANSHLENSKLQKLVQQMQTEKSQLVRKLELQEEHINNVQELEQTHQKLQASYYTVQSRAETLQQQLASSQAELTQYKYNAKQRRKLER